MRHVLSFLVVATALLIAWVVWAIPTNCTVTGTVYRVDGTPCVSCTVNFTNQSSQTIDGVVIAPSSKNVQTDGSGLLPPALEFPQLLMMNVTVQGDRPIPVTIPPQSTVDMATLLATQPPGPPGFPLCLNLPSVTGQVPVWDMANNWWCPGTAGAAAAYNTVQDEGVNLPQQQTLNFAGAGVTCADATTKTTCTIPGGASTFDQIGSGTNTTAAMHVGTGASLDATGSGTIAATTATALAANPTDCGANTFAAAIDAQGNLTCTAIPSAAITAMDWTLLQNYPTACPAGSFVSTLDDVPTCTSNAATATALAANGANCSANQTAGGVDASGAAEACISPLLTPGAVTSNQLVKFSGTGGQATAASACSESAGALSGCTLSFANISSGTNTTATMTVGSGASLLTSGSGAIVATTAGSLQSTTSCSANQAAGGISTGGSAQNCIAPLILAGISGGQTAQGGTSSSTSTTETLTLKPNGATGAAATGQGIVAPMVWNGEMSLFPALGGLTIGNESAISFTPSFTVSGTNAIFRGLNLSPTVTLTTATGGYVAIDGGGVVNENASVTGAVAFFRHTTEYDTLSGKRMPIVRGFYAGPQIYCLGGGTCTATLAASTPAALVDGALLAASGSTSTVDAGTWSTVVSSPSFTSDTGGGTPSSLTVKRIALNVQKPAVTATGTMSVPVNYGLDMPDDTTTGGTDTAVVHSTMSGATGRHGLELTGSANNIIAGGLTVAANSEPHLFGLDVAGALATRIGALTLANGQNDNLSVSGKAFYRIAGPTAAYSITGTSACQDGQRILFYSTVSQTLTLKMNVTSTCKINTPGGADLVFAANSQVLFEMIYDATDSFWVLLWARDSAGPK